MGSIKNKILGLSIALSKVEKNLLSQKINNLDDNIIGVVVEKDIGTLMHGLKNNIVNQEVRDLRWRQYKILNHVNDYVSEVIGRESDGTPIVVTRKKDRANQLKKLKVDSFDDYKVEMVVENEEITMSISDWFDGQKNNNDDIKSSQIDVKKNDRAIQIDRQFPPKFKIEEYATKLVVRNIDGKSKLLEFYFSKYPDTNNKLSGVFLKELFKLTTTKKSSLIEFDSVGFITNKTLGADDYLFYEYKVNSFDKLIEYNGHYVAKFICEVDVDGTFIFNQYQQKELEEKYENKASKHKP